jgi:hypothetical protein
MVAAGDTHNTEALKMQKTGSGSVKPLMALATLYSRKIHSKRKLTLPAAAVVADGIKKKESYD